MREQSVQIVRRGFQAFETTGTDAFTADWHARLVWDVSGYDGWPGSKTSYTGAREMLQDIVYELHGDTIKRIEVCTGYERARKAAGLR